MSTTAISPPTPARLQGRPYARRLATLALIAILSAAGARAEDSSVHRPAATAEELLSGASTVQTDFTVSTGFRLTQNTIQLDTLLGEASRNTFIVDSGAPMTIGSPLAQALGLDPLANIELAGPEGGHREVPVVRIPRIEIGGLGFHDVGAVVDWVEPPDTLACLSRAGLMGASLLQTAIWQIDFQSRQITMSSSLASLQGLENAIRIPFKRSDAAGSPRIAVGVSDADNVSLLIDLGFNGSIAIPTALLERAGDKVADSAPTEMGQASSTVFGSVPSTVRITQLRELRLGELRLRNFPVVTGTSVSDFHVGIDFLRHFRVTLDWQNDELYLELREPRGALYDDFPSYGFAPELRQGQLLVGALWRGSSGEKAGLELGDRLVEIDGQDTTAPDFDSVCSLLNDIGLYGSNDATITVTRLRNGVRESFQVARAPLLQGQ